MPTLDPPYRDLTFMSPLSDAAGDRLADFVAESLPATGGLVVDAGCGWAELLLRTLERAPTARGIGLDLDADAVDHGRDLARRRDLSDRTELIAGDAKEHLPATADALVCIGASQIWATSDAADRPMNYTAALTALRERLQPGGHLVYGEAVWSAPPTPAATAPLAGRADEFVGLSSLLELAVGLGFQPLLTLEASQDDWDAFESGYAACYGRWLAEHSSTHPEADHVRRLAARQREAYFGGYRGILGLAYLGLVAV